MAAESLVIRRVSLASSSSSSGLFIFICVCVGSCMNLFEMYIQVSLEARGGVGSLELKLKMVVSCLTQVSVRSVCALTH